MGDLCMTNQNLDLVPHSCHGGLHFWFLQRCVTVYRGPPFSGNHPLVTLFEVKSLICYHYSSFVSGQNPSTGSESIRGFRSVRNTKLDYLQR